MRELEPIRIRRVRTADLTEHEVGAIRALLWRAFPPEDAMTEDDWAHALGGMHFILERAGGILAHASVVERELHVGTNAIRTGYVEAVAVDLEHQRRGLGTRIMHDVIAYIRDHFELGALGTGSHAFYERLGWRTWQGPTAVRTPDGSVQPTPEEDGYILVLQTPRTPDVNPRTPISCDWRSGDAW